MGGENEETATTSRQRSQSGVNARTEAARAPHARGLPDADWREFCEHIKTRRRFFPDFEEGVPDPAAVLGRERLARLSVRLEAGEAVYRARIGADWNDGAEPRPLPEDELSAPPIRRARAGRANPAGIRVLYAASDPETAIAEVRPWLGAHVSVARFRLERAARLVDLREQNAENGEPGDAAATALVRAIGEEMSKPLDPELADIDYVPTQYVAELVRDGGYDGVIYRSALGAGRNYVFFEPDALAFEEAALYRVTRLDYDQQLL